MKDTMSMWIRIEDRAQRRNLEIGEGQSSIFTVLELCHRILIAQEFMLMGTVDMELQELLEHIPMLVVKV